MIRRTSRCLLALTTLCLAVAGCFGDDRTHAADDDPAECGDGLIDPGEQCDDGDTAGGDGCDAACDVETGWSCLGEPSVCSMTTGSCGDGAIASGEDCDDGDTTGGDGCSAACDVEAGWECAGSPSHCNPLCGNGHLDPGEDCDGGADCDATCHLIAACTLVSPQTGCPADSACDLDGVDGSTACRAVTSEGTSNNHCTTATACAAGYTCLGDAANVNSTACHRFCDVDSNCTGAGARCLLQIDDGTGNPVPGVTVCTNHCDPAAQSGCPSGQACYAYEDGTKDYTDCTLPGTRAVGQTCSVVEDCQLGLMCISQGGTDVCRRTCEVGTACTTGSCTGFTAPIVIDGAEIGVCL